MNNKKRKINNIYDINYYTCITILTITMMNPKQQITKVSQTTCINATKEKSFRIFSENEIILLCLSISISNETGEAS